MHGGGIERRCPRNVRLHISTKTRMKVTTYRGSTEDEVISVDLVWAEAFRTAIGRGVDFGLALDASHARSVLGNPVEISMSLQKHGTTKHTPECARIFVKDVYS